MNEILKTKIELLTVSHSTLGDIPEGVGQHTTEIFAHYAYDLTIRISREMEPDYKSITR